MFFLSKLKKILIILFSSKIIFKDPNKTDILVLDNLGKDRLMPLIENYNYYILPIRDTNINELNFSLKVLNNLIRNIRKTKLSTAYFCSIIEAIGPKLIITSIDNSFQISDIAKILSKKFNFLAIQNAARYELDEYGREYSSRFFIPELACFGNFEKSLYKKHNVKVKKFFVCGSLNVSNYHNFINSNKKKNKLIRKKYDICLISEASIRTEEKLGSSDFELGKIRDKGIGTLAEFTVRLAKKHNLKLVFAGKKRKFKKSALYKKENQLHVNERLFYKKYIKGNYKILTKKHTYSSYQLMSNSKLAIAMQSTLLRENLALGGKILSCNFTNNKIWDFPIQGICSLNNLNFEKFEKRVLKLLSISYRNYILNLKKKPKYLIHFSKSNSTHDLLKKKIRSFMV